jgi:hypothetical protein
LIATIGTSNSFMPLLYLFIHIERLPTILPAQSVTEILAVAIIVLLFVALVCS